MEVWCVQPDTELIRIQSKIYRFLLCYTYPTLFKKYKRAPASHVLHSGHVSNLNHILLKFNMFCVRERLNWTLLKNEFCYLNSTVPGLDTFVSVSTNIRNSRTMPLLEVQRHNSETFKKSVHYRTVTVWNSLPKEWDLSESNSLTKF